MMARTATIALTAALALAAGCSGDDSTGPDPDPGGLEFPAIDAAVLQAFCVRGQGTMGQTRSGTLDDDDCWSSDYDPEDDSYFETWRVRVGSAGTVTFDVSSGFDSWLEVYRLERIENGIPEVTLLAWNDDRGGGDLDALVSASLQAGRDYFVIVSGYDDSDTGPYSLAIR